MSNWKLAVLAVLFLQSPVSADEWLSYPGHGENAGHHIVLVAGDQEYRSEETLPQLARILSTTHGFRCTVLFAQDPEKPGFVNATPPVEIPGLDHLKSADLMIIFTRFIALPDAQMKLIDDYLRSGGPVIGIRTSTHAFAFPKDSPWRHYGNKYDGKKHDAWRGGFGRLVLGERWIAHHGKHKHQSTRGKIAPGALGDELLNGINDGEIWGASDVYRVRLPLPGDARALVLGQVVERDREFDSDDLFFGMRDTDTRPGVVDSAGVTVNDPMMPIAWTKSYQVPGGKKGRVFTSTIGSSTDMLSDALRRLWVNGVYWALHLPVPEKANVDIVGEYSPTQFRFHDAGYWDERELAISSLK